MLSRADRHNNPIACTTDICIEAGLKDGVDFITGDSFVANGHTYFTAKLLKDPVATSIAIIDKLGYFTHSGQPRWTYIAIPAFDWNESNFNRKKRFIAYHYQHEGGITMKGLFA